jgi:hypothetical protein
MPLYCGLDIGGPQFLVASADRDGEKLIASAVEVMEDHLRILPVPAVRLSRLGYDTALMGAIVLAMKDEPIVHNGFRRRKGRRDTKDEKDIRIPHESVSFSSFAFFMSFLGRVT